MNKKTHLRQSGDGFLEDFAYGFSLPFEYAGAPLAAIGSAVGVPELAVLPAIGKAARKVSGRGVVLAGKGKKKAPKKKKRAPKKKAPKKQKK